MRRLIPVAMALVLAACGRTSPPAEPPPMPLRFDRVAGLSELQQGERLAFVLGCNGCHGRNLQGQPWEEEAGLAISFSSNLTRALPDYSDAMLIRAIRAGVRRDGSALWGMPSEIFTELDPADLAAVIAWLRTHPPALRPEDDAWVNLARRREVAAGNYKPTSMLVLETRRQGPVRFDAAHDHARYMIRATCAECHGLTITGRPGEGQERGPPDLAIAGAYTRQDFHRLMRTGVAAGGRQVGLMSQVARNRFSHLTDAEVDAIYDYLAARARR